MVDAALEGGLAWVCAETVGLAPALLMGLGSNQRKMRPFVLRLFCAAPDA
jgi:hypothetical protein